MSTAFCDKLIHKPHPSLIHYTIYNRKILHVEKLICVLYIPMYNPDNLIRGKCENKKLIIIITIVIIMSKS
jgi:hypothetical protein